MEVNIENHTGPWDDAPFTAVEHKFILDKKISEHVIRERRIFLKRSLSYEELVILELLESNAILFRDEYFKPFV